MLIIVAWFCCGCSCRVGRGCGLKYVNDVESSPASRRDVSLVVVTHGWVEKGEGEWPEDMATAISERVDPNKWLVGYFDWRKGARTINPVDAARYGRDIVGKELAEEVLSLKIDFKHIHLLGHSSGCWVVSEAAKVLAEKTDADIHLTFFDAYIPSDWDQEQLGAVKIKKGVNFWADHYYTRDYTGGWTECDLTNAHNVDVTKLDQHIKDHNFPWRWYYATITGSYPKGNFLDDDKFACRADGVEYGFVRSAEAGGFEGWEKSLKLSRGERGVLIPQK